MKKKKNFTLGKDWTTQFQLHTLMLPGTVCIIVFSILPLFGLILAFKNYLLVQVCIDVFNFVSSILAVFLVYFIVSCINICDAVIFKCGYHIVVLSLKFLIRLGSNDLCLLRFLFN